MHDNASSPPRQSFEAEARRRGLCPVVVSTLREPEEEVRTVERLVSYGLDALMVAGATDAPAVGAVCRAAGVEHVYLDLPGPDAPSVVSDNRSGARLLTETLLDRMTPGSGPRGKPYFLGGSPSDAATSRRIAGFREAVEHRFGEVGPGQVLACGYAPSRARAELAALRERLGGLPAALFINSITVFEGALARLVALPMAELEGCAIGCYDHDPIASFLPFPVHMMRQNSEALVARAFAIIDAGVSGAAVEEIAPELVPPRSILPSPFDDLG
jgi:LacI family fructose operon transcriptional repressor